MPADPVDVQYFKRLYQEKYHRLIESSLDWLADQEPEWGLDQPINKENYIADLVSHVSKGDAS